MFNVLTYFYCKIYIFYWCYGNNLFKTYFSLWHEWFKIEVPKTTQKRDWTKYFPYDDDDDDDDDDDEFFLWYGWPTKGV